MNLTQKIIGSHLVSGTMTPGSEIGLRIDQTLTQDATGTMAWLQFEALGIPRVKTDISLSYVDHNTLQMNFRNPDDHRFLRTVAAKFGGVYSGPGTGICHQLHLENFAKPGATLVGSDSHTPTAGGICSLAMGAGGLSVALAMAGEPYYIPMPKVVRVFLTGALTGWASAKDVILELLRRRTVKGGVGRVFEYAGPGVATLSVPERATIANMGAELGATGTLFPSDGVTRASSRPWAAKPTGGNSAPTPTPRMTKRKPSIFPRWFRWPRSRTCPTALCPCPNSTACPSSRSVSVPVRTPPTPTSSWSPRSSAGTASIPAPTP